MDSRGRIGPVAVVGTFLGLAMLAAGITLLYLGMRSVMEIGGACAEGGPYVTRQDCPDGVPALLFGGAWGGLIGAGIFALSARRLGGGYWRLVFWAWPALFLSLGWNFLEYGLDPPGGVEGAATGWIVCAVVFGVMGGAPLLFLLLPSQLRATFWPPDRDKAEPRSPVTPFAGMLSRSVRSAAAPGWSAEPPAAPGFGASTPPPGPEPPATPAATAPATAPSAGGLWTGLPGQAPGGAGMPAAGTPAAGGDVVTQLERLARLRQSGALDEAEYERVKRSILGGGT